MLTQGKGIKGKTLMSYQFKKYEDQETSPELDKVQQ